MYFLSLQIKFLNSVIVDLQSKNASLQEQLDTLMLTSDDADLYDIDINADFRLICYSRIFHEIRLLSLNGKTDWISGDDDLVCMSSCSEVTGSVVTVSEVTGSEVTGSVVSVVSGSVVSMISGNVVQS